jgi:hypothetical protein
MTISSTGDKEGPDPLLVHDDETEIPAQPADFNVGLVSWRFISSAIRRAARFWGALAVTGLLIGVAVDVALPPPHQASTSLLLTNGPEAALGAAIVDEQAVVQSRTVAGLALHKLGLQQSVDSFLKSYTATVLTDRVLTDGSTSGPAAVALAAPASLPGTAKGCSTSAAQGKCGPYDSYPDITGTTSSTYIGNNVWNPVHGSQQTLTATDPGDWQVTANMPAGNTAVASYPSIGANYGQSNNVSTPLSSFSLIDSWFTENMHAMARTSAWAAYDIWLGHGASSNWTYEVMIQHDFAGNGACTSLATAAFLGPGGVLQDWHLCKYGSELIWKLGANDKKKVSEWTGVVHILVMLLWLEHHGYLPANAGLWAVGYGWEICSTGGQPETFTVSSYALRTRCRAHYVCQ